jgi:hypothetical protein
MLKLRRGVVSGTDPLVVRLGGKDAHGFDASHMGRSIDQDRLFFAAALAAGDGLAAAALVKAVR